MDVMGIFAFANAKDASKCFFIKLSYRSFLCVRLLFRSHFTSLAQRMFNCETSRLVSDEPEMRRAFVKPRCSSKASSLFAGSFAGACAVFSHTFSEAFIERPMTKAVLVVHTKARACSSL